jgi:GntR family transcriptional regulator/MocR family aminotransferase
MDLLAHHFTTLSASSWLRPTCLTRMSRPRLLAAQLAQTGPQGEAAGLHLLLRLPAGLDPQTVSVAAAAHGLTMGKASWHWANLDTAPPALLIGYGSVREGDLARGIESLRV